jgi:hypothetical protein
MTSVDWIGNPTDKRQRRGYGVDYRISGYISSYHGTTDEETVRAYVLNAIRRQVRVPAREHDGQSYDFIVRVHGAGAVEGKYPMLARYEFTAPLQTWRTTEGETA